MQFKIPDLPAGLHVRPSLASDKPFLETLYKSVREDLDSINDTPDLIEYVKEQQYDAQTESYGDQFPNAVYFVIEYHHEAVGRVTLDFSSNEIRIVDLSLIKKARGKGLGTGIINAFISCAETTHTPLTLGVLSHNIQAKQLYLQLGFLIENIRPPRDYLIYYPKSMGQKP
ncbi:MAG TPA: GNAT family N-acetyltransferase [Crenotrichaceae bacterium]|nr:GNAT family N-acetyltransferase [Crenotrichaceae bacterium]